MIDVHSKEWGHIKDFIKHKKLYLRDILESIDCSNDEAQRCRGGLALLRDLEGLAAPSPVSQSSDENIDFI